MNMSESKQGNITILQPQGKLNAITSPEMDTHLAGLIEGGTRQIVIDLAGLDYVSSAGLRVFLSVAKSLQHVAGKLTLASPSPQVQQMLDIAGFGNVLSIYKTLNEAIAACTL